ncbi:MAG TPA: outer membrane beta-barrel protein [Marinilabiliaceae bacterium]|nr:outer membrane beta-barrel protein [Marinilabiliaceae bacterium]
MNHLYLIFYFLLFVLSNSLSAQSFKGGVKGGLVASEVSGDELAGLNKFGFFGSAFTMYPISNHSFLQMEVMYIQKGSRAVPKEENLYSDYFLSLHYVEVPLLYVQDLSIWSHVLNGTLVHGGLSLSKLVNHKETKDGTTFFSTTNFNTLEANFLLGISYPITHSLHASLGFSNSLTPIRPHPGGQTTWKNRGQYNSVWTLGLSYIFW